MSLAIRLRIRSADDTADALVISTLPSDAHPYVLELPSGDGQSFDPLDGTVTIGVMNVQVIDATEGGAYVVTSQLADASGRQQLLSRRAYVDQSLDGGASWSVLQPGYVNAVRLTQPGVFEVTVGESRRVEIATKIFQAATPGLDRVCCRIGGPVIGDFGPAHDRGPTVWTVDLVGTVADSAGRKLVRLAHTSGWWPVDQDTADWQFVRGALPQYARDRANAGLSTMQTTGHPFDAAFGLFQGVQGLDGFEVRVRRTGTANAYVTMTAGSTTDLFSGIPALVSPSNRLILWWEVTANTPLPTVGQAFDLYGYATDISESNPLHIDLHPVDLLTTLWDADHANIPFDATAAASVRALLGSNRRWKLRITESTTLAEFAQKIYGAEGLATRIDGQGRLVLFSSRIKLDTLPTVTWTLNDLADPDTVIFDLDEKTVANAVTIKGQRFAQWTPESGEARPIDDILTVPQTRGADNGDASTFGNREIIYEIPGTIASDASHDGDLLGVAVAGAQQIFDRYGRGAIAGDVTILADSPQAELGQEVILDVPHLPNRTVRGGPRCLQVVQKTSVLGVGFSYHLIDSGSTAQTATQPTFTLAKDAHDGKHLAIVSLTNVPTIAAAGFGIALQYAIGATQPASGGILFWSGSAGVMVDLGLSTDIPVPLVAAGSTVWVRAQSVSYSQRPSAWTAWQSVTLDGLAAPSGLTATAVAGDATAMDLTWTVGEASIPPEIDLRLTSQTTTRFVARPPAGSATYRLTGLDPSTSYTATVTYRLHTPTGDLSSSASVAFTTSGTTPTLAAPTDPVGVVGRETNPFAIPGVQLTGTSRVVIDGTYGLDVTCAELFGDLVVEVATETGIGTDTPGAFVVQPSVPVRPAGRTPWRGSAPNDGLARYLRAKVHRAGATDSAYCAPVKVFPWSTAVRPQDVKIAAPDFALTYASRASASGPQLVFRIGFTAPTSPYYARTRFTVTPPTGGAFTVEAVDGDPPPEVPLPWGATYQVFAQAITTSGVVGDAGPTQPAAFGLFVFPGFPIGVPIFDPVAYNPTTGAPVAGYVPRGDPSDDTGLTLHDQMQDSAGHNVSDAITTALANAAQAISDAAGAQATADGKVTTFVAPSTAPPTAEGDGDLWIVSDLDNVLRRWNAGASAWVDVRDAGIAQAIGAAADAQSTADSKIVTFYAPSTAPPTADGEGDLWILTDIVGTVKRWNGTAWVVVQSAGALAPSNMLTNGSAELGTVGQAAPGYTFGQGVPLLVTDTAAKNGTRSLSYTHTAADDSFSTVALPVTAGHVYALGGWIKTDAFLAGTSGVFRYGAYLIVQANGQTLTRLDRVGSAFRTTESTANIEVGVVADGAAHDFAFVAVLFRAETTGTVLYAPELFTQDAGTAWIDGVVFEEIPPGTSRYYDALDASGNLNSGVTQASGGQQRVISKGYIEGFARNGQAITFVQPFEQAPAITVYPGIFGEPRSKWGSSAVVDAHDQNPAEPAPSGAPNAALPQYPDLAALNPSASGFHVRARLRQKTSSTTGHTVPFSPATITAPGATMDATLTAGPATDDNYQINYDISVFATSPAFGTSSTTTVTLTFSVVIGGAEFGVGSRTYTFTSPTDTISEAGQTWSGEVFPFAKAGLNNGDAIRIRIASIATGPGAGRTSVDGNSVTYTTSASGDTYASMTPDASDTVRWTAQAVSI